MPIITERTQILLHKETQKTCIKCDQEPGRNERNAIIICDICEKWFCKTCAVIDEKLYDFVIQQDLAYDHICNSCKGQIPKIKDLINISEKQTQMQLEIDQMKAEINSNKKSIEKYESFESRLSDVEKVIVANKLNDVEYPPLLAINDAQTKIQRDLSSQAETTTKLNIDLEEKKRREAISQNLIVYGLPEKQTNLVKEQMKADFEMIKDLLTDRVDLHETDISHISRLGAKKQDKERPIRITFVDLQKRREVLVNNKNITIEDQLNECNCKNPGKHIHINITTDKTKQEREQESKLREQLQNRRKNGEDVVIKRGKIVPRNNLEAYPRWATICQNGW